MRLFGIDFSKPNRLFGVLPDYVTDTKKYAPGTAPIRPVPTFTGWLTSYATGTALYTNENGWWILMTLILYCCFPYDLSKTSPAYASALSWEFMRERLLVWGVCVLGYVGFFHVGCHVMPWCQRQVPKVSTVNRPSKLIHNIFYNCVGVFVWCALENAMCHVWATGMLPHLQGDILVTSKKRGDEKVKQFVMRSALLTAGGFLFALMIKDLHFFFMHRLLHAKPFYTCIHALHHRNTGDAGGVFGGITMHQVELLYYVIAASMPPLVMWFAFGLPTHPVCFVWIGMHQLVSPALAHSGIEDNLQSDVAHLYHHRFTDVNFGPGPSMWLDNMTGSSFYGCEEEDKKAPRQNTNVLVSVDEKRLAEIMAETPHDVKATLWPDFGATLRGGNKDGILSLYTLLVTLCWLPWVLHACKVNSNNKITSLVGIREASLLFGFGPLVAAALVEFSFTPAALFAPFWKKRRVIETMLLFVAGLLCSAVPVSIVCALAISK